MKILLAVMLIFAFTISDNGNGTMTITENTGCNVNR